ncbi:hypothetical protein HN51_029413 [Arachis hypogaea]
MVLENAKLPEGESPQEEDSRLRSVKKAKPNGDESLPDADDNVKFVGDGESMIIENPNSSQGIQSSENKSTLLDGCGPRMKDPEQVPGSRPIENQESTQMDLVGRQNEAHLESRVKKPQHNKAAMFAKPATIGKENKKPSQKPHTNQNKGTIVNTSVSTWKGKEIEGSSSTEVHNQRKENYWNSINLIKQAQSMEGSDGWENGMFPGGSNSLTLHGSFCDGGAASP